MASFNLVDAPWIPCADGAGGEPRLLSLRGVFRQAPQLVAIADPSPAVTISLYRLLLAILHRCLEGPRNAREWDAIWRSGTWDLDRIDGYLGRWHSRFDLFDTQHPFFQTPGIDASADPKRPANAITTLTHERASDRNRSLLFDHSPVGTEVSAGTAARYLVAQHQFAVGGLISLGSGEPIANKYTVAAPLLGGAVVLIRGETLFQTLMLNWVQYSRENQMPFPFGGDDAPAWERDGGARPEPRLPDGYVDLLTWQSRRILLLPSISSGDVARVDRVILMKGFQFAESFEQWSAETMLAFRKNTNSKAGPAWFAIRLNPDRMVWRDSHAWLQSVANVLNRPKTMDWLDTLMGERYLPEQAIQPLEIYGLIPDQANIRDWRRETIQIPLRLLRADEEVAQKLVERLREALQRAEEIGQLFDATLIEIGRDKARRLRSPMWVLGQELLTGLSSREPKRDECADAVRRFSAGARYWSQLDVPFRRFLEQLADPEDLTIEDGARLYGMRALRTWVSTAREVARDVFNQVIAELDTSGRALRASAQASQRFYYLLAALTASYRPSSPTLPEEGVSA